MNRFLLWLKLPFRFIFDWEHVLTPIAIEHRQAMTGGTRTYRHVYVFGVRVAYYSTTKFQK